MRTAGVVTIMTALLTAPAFAEAEPQGPATSTAVSAPDEVLPADYADFHHWLCWPGNLFIVPRQRAAAGRLTLWPPVGAGHARCLREPCRP